MDALSLFRGGRLNTGLTLDPARDACLALHVWRANKLRIPRDIQAQVSEVEVSRPKPPGVRACATADQSDGILTADQSDGILTADQPDGILTADQLDGILTTDQQHGITADQPDGIFAGSVVTVSN